MYSDTTPARGGQMLKALLVMIVLSNDYAARVLQRINRHSLA
jgi:hypothetical protein